jgi:hypothetical protein
MVRGMCTVDIVDDPKAIAAGNSPKGKPFLRLTFPGLEPIDITTNLAEMIGGAGAGLRKRQEDEEALRR